MESRQHNRIRADLRDRPYILDGLLLPGLCVGEGDVGGVACALRDNTNLTMIKIALCVCDGCQQNFVDEQLEGEAGGFYCEQVCLLAGMYRCTDTFFEGSLIGVVIKDVQSIRAVGVDIEVIERAIGLIPAK